MVALSEIDRGGSQSTESALTLYLWFAICVLSVCLHQPAFPVYAVPAPVTFVLPLLVLCSLLSLSQGRLSRTLLFVGYAATIFFIHYVSALNPLTEVRLLVGLVILSALPICFFGLWRSQEQGVAFGLAALLTSIQVVRDAGWLSIGWVVVLLSLAILAAALRYRVEASDVPQRARPERESAQILLLQHAWPTTAFQAGILLTVSFSSILLDRSPDSAGRGPHFYGLAILMLGSLLLIVAGQAVRRAVFFTMTVLFAALISVSFARPFPEPIHDVQIALGLVGLVLLHLSTLSLPWGTRTNVGLAWLITGLGTTSFLLAERSATAMSPFGGILAGGLAVSLILGYLFERASLELHTESQATSNAPIAARGLVPLRMIAREGIAKRRFELLLPALFLAAVFASVLSLVLTGGVTWLQLGFASFYVLWAAMVHLSRRHAGQEPLWFVGALSALLLFLWTCAIITLTGITDPVWLLVPAGVLLLCGLIPWRTVEIFPLVIATVIIGTTTSFQVGEVRFGLFFLCAGILSWYLSASTHRRIRERYLLQEFQQVLRGTRTFEETLYTLADYLSALFGDGSVLIVRGGVATELIQSGQATPIVDQSFDLNRLSPHSLTVSALERAVRIGSCNWLRQSLRIPAGEGVFAPQHALIVELDLLPERAGEEVRQALPGITDVAERVRLIVPTQLPLMRLLVSDQLYLTEALAGEALLRVRAYAEESLRRRAEQAAFAIQADRDYELSSLVHDINNTVQDQALLCDGVIEDLTRELGQDPSLAGTHATLVRDAISRVRRIAVSSRAMAAVVSDAKRKRELDRIEDLHPREMVDVQQVVDEVHEFALVRSERRRVSIERHGSEEVELMVRVSSRDHLETALRSLLNNAILVSSPGTAVSIKTRASGEWIWVDIQDTGPGLSPEERRALLRGEALRQWGGNDLGFSQLRRFAEAQGGSLDVSSVGAGRGTVFTLLFPRQSVAPRKEHQAWVLVVDDEPSLVQSYARIIRALHLEPLMATSIDEALRALQGREQPCLVVTDLNLGAESGRDLIISLRTRFDKTLPILIVSGVDDEELLGSLSNDFGCATVTKPIGQRALFSKIESLVTPQKTGRAS